MSSDRIGAGRWKFVDLSSEAYLDYVAECSNLGLSLDDPFAKFSRELLPLSFDKFLVIFNVIVPAIPATPSVKGHFTGHSFRPKQLLRLELKWMT